MGIYTGICAQCGDIATVLHTDEEGWVTPICETCLEKVNQDDGDDSE